MKRESGDEKGTTARAAVDRYSKQWSGGDFFDPNASLSVPRETARRQFLELARELYHVTANLRDTVLPHYAKDAAAFNEECVGRALREWCARYQLRQPWVLNQVRDTLTLWTIFPEVARLSDTDPLWHPLFHIVKRRPRPADTVPFVFNFACPTFEITPGGVVHSTEPGGWNLELDQRNDFVDEALRQFKDALKD